MTRSTRSKTDVNKTNNQNEPNKDKNSSELDQNKRKLDDASRSRSVSPNAELVTPTNSGKKSNKRRKLLEAIELDKRINGEKEGDDKRGENNNAKPAKRGKSVADALKEAITVTPKRATKSSALLNETVTTPIENEGSANFCEPG